MYDYAIIFENDTTPLAKELSAALSNLGYTSEITDTLDSALMSALSAYRKEISMPQLNFCDPATLRSLGIAASGDELVTLALAANELGGTEIEYFDICREIVNESRNSEITLTEACARRNAIGKSHTEISESAMRAAILAFLNG